MLPVNLIHLTISRTLSGILCALCLGGTASRTLAAEMAPEAKAVYDQALSEMRLGKTERAILLYEKAVALAPDSQEAWLELGSALGQAGRLQEAARAEWSSLEIQESSRAWLKLGNILTSGEQFSAADSAFLTAEKLSNGSYHAAPDRITIGYRQMMVGLPSAAIKTFEAIVSMDPNACLPHVYMGDAFLMLGKRAEAGAAYTKASQGLSQNPTDMDPEGVAAALKTSLGRLKAGTADAPPFDNLAGMQSLPERFGQCPAAGKARELLIDPVAERRYWLKSGTLLCMSVPADWTEKLSMEAGRLHIAYLPPNPDHFAIINSVYAYEKPKEDIPILIKTVYDGAQDDFAGIPTPLLPFSLGTASGYWFRGADKKFDPANPAPDEHPYYSIILANVPGSTFLITLGSQDTNEADALATLAPIGTATTRAAKIYSK